MCCVCYNLFIISKATAYKDNIRTLPQQVCVSPENANIIQLKPQTSNVYVSLIIWKAFQLADVEMQVELHNKAMHGQPPLPPPLHEAGAPLENVWKKTNTQIVCGCARAPVGQSCTSGPDRPLSQLLPDLQLNQHGFSRAWYFSSATQNNIRGRASDHSRFS